jgi:hypothetical protein
VVSVTEKEWVEYTRGQVITDGPERGVPIGITQQQRRIDRIFQRDVASNSLMPFTESAAAAIMGCPMAQARTFSASKDS